MPYRIDLHHPPCDALEQLVELGALDVERFGEVLAALMPDRVPAGTVATALNVIDFEVSDAIGRDDGSVWMLSSRPVRAGRFSIVPAGLPAHAPALRLIDGPAFGTGLHPTTALCLEMLDDLLGDPAPAGVVDVGTGSGVLALAALSQGVGRAIGLDIDREALAVAAENARINEVGRRLLLVQGGADAVRGTWPLVVANILAAPLIEMAPALVRRVGHRGRLLLSGIPSGMADDVERPYRRLGMRLLQSETRAGWSALVLGPSW